MHRINAVSSVIRNANTNTNLKLFSQYNLSLLPVIRNTSFFHLLFDNLGNDNILDNITKVLEYNGISYTDLSQEKSLGIEFIPISSKGIVQLSKNTVNNNLKVSKNFNKKLKNIYSDTSNPLLQVVPSQTRVSSHYGWRNDPFTGQRTFHKGIDISAPKGSPIYPIKEGTVEEVGYNRGYGNYLRVKHDDGTVSLYAHNECNLVKQGERVNTTTQIAKVGATGRATGSHLHLEILQGGKAIDPHRFLDNIQYANSGHQLETRG